MKTKYLFALFVGLTLILVGCSNQDLEQQLQQLQSQVNNINQQNQDLESHLNNLQNSLDTVQNELNSKTNELEEVKTDSEREKDCIVTKYEYMVKHNAIYANSIMIGFVEGVDEDEAEQIVSEYGLSLHSKSSMFSTMRWATVDAPTGKEIEWACKLEGHEKIEGADPEGLAGGNQEFPSIYSCESNNDCILVVAGCSVCPSCDAYNLTDPEVIAVNKNYYKCPPHPGGVCVACEDVYHFDLRNDAICVDNRCEKK